MPKPKIFVDGQSGTTGLQIYDRIKTRSDIEVMHIPEADRKDNAAKLDYIRRCDLVFLCLPDDSAVEMVSLLEAENIAIKIIDASTAHRTASGWTYGFPELKPDYRGKIASSSRVANVGCYASGFIAPIKPLIDSNLLPRRPRFCCECCIRPFWWRQENDGSFFRKGVRRTRRIIPFLTIRAKSQPQTPN